MFGDGGLSVSEIIDRIAAAIRAKHHHLYITTGPSAEMQLEDLVRDILQETRGPTEEMTAAGRYVLKDNPNNRTSRFDLAKDIFNEMIGCAVE